MNPSVGGVVGVGGGGVGGGIGVVGVGGGVGVPAAGPPPPAVATTPIMPVSGIPASPLPVGVGVGVSVGAASPVGTAMDSLSQALKANIIPNQEYLLQGSVLDSAVEVLLHRLRGLCDNVDAGPETFHDQEVCFSLRGPTQQSAPLLLRVRKALDCPDSPYQLRYIGQPELGDKSRPTVVRSSIDIACSGMVVEFLTELGCRIDFEYSVRGYMFRKGRMKITVAKVFKMSPMHPKHNEVFEPISQSYLVELSVLAPSGQDAIAEDMKIFADQLRPLVQLDKIDYKRLGHIP